MERIVSKRVIDLEIVGEARSIITTFFFFKTRCLYTRIWSNSGWVVSNRGKVDEGKMHVLFLIPVGGRSMASQRC